MKKLNRREIIIFFICLILVLTYVIYNFVIQPMRERGSDVADNVANAELRLIKTRRIVQSGALIERQYKKLVEKVGVSSSQGAEFSQIISKIESLAKEANIHIGNVQPQQAITKEALRVYPVEIDIDGSWPAIARFLYLVQAAPNSFHVEELNLEKFSENVVALRGRVILSRVRVAASR